MALLSDKAYNPGDSDCDIEDSEESLGTSRASQEFFLPSGTAPKRSNRGIRVYLTISTAANIAFGILLFYLVRYPRLTDKSQILYTPAENIIEYKAVTFSSGYLEDKSRWQSDGQVPTDEQDKAWKDLYHELIYSRIPKKQARRLTNATVPIIGDEGMYIAGLDVFHQLHCLDNLRKSQWPSRYSPEAHMGGQGMSLLSAKHLDHCIDQIRQSLMCASDVSTGWLKWNDRMQRNLAVMSTTHSCRNFEKVHEWAMERKLLVWDPTIRAT